MKHFIIDIETNKLENPDIIWCVVVEDLNSNKVWMFTTKVSFSVWYFNQVCKYDELKFIGHNILEFDAPQLSKIWGVKIPDENILDTILLSRLYSPKLEGGHSLRSWGERLNDHKIEFEDFSAFTEEMLTYCKQDVALTKKLYKHLLSKLGPTADFAINLEHKVALLLKEAKERGFYFDLNKALDIRRDLDKERSKLDELIVFPDVPKYEWFIPKKDNIKKGYVKDVPFLKTKYVPFNPNSGQHIINECWKAGWKPTEKTEGHKEFLKDPPWDKEERRKKKERYEKYGWKVSEGNLATLPDDAPDSLRHYLKRLIYETRIRKLDEWCGLLGEDGAIHGNIIGLGAWTHRMTHQNPNLANIAAKKSIKYNTEELKALALDLGGKLRELWVARKDHVLVGTDAEGIQLRVLAHYMEDDEFTEAVTYGKKEDGTDPHTLNQKRIGRGSRDNSKTFIYAFILGAGDEKVGEIYGISKREGGELKEGYINSTPGLKRLKSGRIPSDAHQGYTIGFDGRKILCNSKHLMMAAYLQGGEAIVMKTAVVLAIDRMRQKNIEAYLVNVVHDEMIFECLPEVAEEVKIITEWSIAEAGKVLKLRCPMKGVGAIGKTWLEVH